MFNDLIKNVVNMYVPVDTRMHYVAKDIPQIIRECTN